MDNFVGCACANDVYQEPPERGEDGEEEKLQEVMPTSRCAEVLGLGSPEVSYLERRRAYIKAALVLSRTVGMCAPWSERSDMERRGVKSFAEVEMAFEGLRSQRDLPPGFNPDDFLPQLRYSIDGGRNVDRLKPTISAMVQADVRKNDTSSEFFDISVKFSTTRFVLSRSLEDFYGLHKKLKSRVPNCAKTLPPLPTAREVRNTASALHSSRPSRNGENEVTSCASSADVERSNRRTGRKRKTKHSVTHPSFFGEYFFGETANATNPCDFADSSFNSNNCDKDNDDVAGENGLPLGSETRGKEKTKYTRLPYPSSSASASRDQGEHDEDECCGKVVTRKLRSYLSQVIDWFRARRAYDPDVLAFLDLDADLLLRLHREDMRVVRNIVVSWGGHVAHALPLPWVNAFVQSITPHRRRAGSNDDAVAGNPLNSKGNGTHLLPARQQPGPIELRKLLEDGPALAATSWALVTKPAWLVLSTVYGADIELDIDTLRKLLLDHSLSSNQAGLDHPPTSLLGLPVAAPS